MTDGGAPQNPGLRLSQAQTSDLLARHAAVLGGARLEALQALGLDVIEAERGGAYVTGTDGRQFLDCYSGAGVFNLGRRPAEVVDGLRAAVRLTDQGNFPLISAEKADYATGLAEFVPGDLGCTLFSVSRGEAMDFACKLARACTSRHGLVTVAGAWYGYTGFALSLSERPGKERSGPLIPGVTAIPWNDLAAANEALNGRTAAMVLEPVQAENGCRCVEPDYLRRLAHLCRERGVLLILDETQSGMGRTGSRFAYGRWGVVPDILVLGESLAAGVFPICATMFRPDLRSFLDEHPLIHLSTFGGSDVGCVVGRKALDVYRREQPWRNAAVMGERLQAALASLAAAQPAIVKSVTGLGLLLALDLGGEEAARSFCRALADAGVLAMPGLVATGTVVLRPSLLITADETDRIATACAAAADALASAAKPARRRTPAAGGVEKKARAGTVEKKTATKPARPRASRSQSANAAGNDAKAAPKRSGGGAPGKPRTRRKPAAEQ